MNNKKTISFQLWIITAIFLIATYFFTSGSQLYKLISVIDTFIYFLYIYSFFLFLLFIISSLATKHLKNLISTPRFLKNNFLIESKEKSFDNLNDEGKEKFTKVNSALSKFTLWPTLGRFLLSIVFILLAYSLVDNHFVPEVVFNSDVSILLALNISILIYFFYSQTKYLRNKDIEKDTK